MQSEEQQDAYNIACDAATKHLGWPGRILAASKSGYTTKYPKRVVAFNGNVCTKEHGKIWYGDVDTTKDKKALKALAKDLGCVVYVLREMDARFSTEGAPLFERAIFTTEDARVA